MAALEDTLPVSEIQELQCLLSGHGRHIEFLSLRKIIAKRFARGSTVHSNQTANTFLPPGL